MFSHSGSSFPFSVGLLDDGSSLDPPPIGKGGNVEGALANALWLMFRDHVVTPAVDPNPKVTRSISGDLSTVGSNSWIFNADVATRFQQLIWDPFNTLAGFDPPSSNNFVGAIQAGAGSDWFTIKACFYLMNIGIEFVSLSSISVPQGPVAGGTTLTVQGDGFVAPKSFGGESVTMRVLFNGVAATGITVNSATEIEATTPAGLGTGLVDVVIELWVRGTVADNATLAGAFEYI